MRENHPSTFCLNKSERKPLDAKYAAEVRDVLIMHKMPKNDLIQMLFASQDQKIRRRGPKTCPVPERSQRSHRYGSP
ncbi:hypothetical protein J6590_092944 [Homalodisca vitripennis]|nr:hypothetical protein J6590_092944 [Homalodisca vitripennis]